METTPSLPEAILRDLQLYLADGEIIQKCIASASGVVGRLGELWMVLTDRTIFFHTREFGKEAVVALLPRRDISSILYFQSRRGYTLTFTPRSAPQNITRVTFPREQREPLEAFCEELADLIEFQAEGHPPIKPGESLPTSAPGDRPPLPPVTTVSAVPSLVPSRLVEAAQPAVVQRPPEIQPPAVSPSVRLARPASPDPEGAPAASSTAVRLVSGEGPGLKYTFLATLVALAVSFLWYRLFLALEEPR